MTSPLATEPTTAPAAAAPQAAPAAFKLTIGADGIALVCFDVPNSANKLSVALFGEVEDLLARLERETAVQAVVLYSGKPDSYIVGADLEDIAAQTSAEATAALSRRAQKMMDRFEASRAPIVAAINGTCVGGGMELALACAYRIATDAPKTVLALPEVKLGLLPAAGGCQRMPRLIGLEAALDLILAGKNVYPRKALKLGLVDEVCPKEVLLDVARRAAAKLASGEIRPRRGPRFSMRRLMLEMNPWGRKLVYKLAKKGILSKTYGLYPAPLKALDAIKTGIEAGQPMGYETEAKLFGELVGGDGAKVAKNLIGLFFAMQGSKKDGGDGPKPRPIAKLGVIGAGFMGSGIAIVAADAGTTVRLRDRDLPSVGRGLKAVNDHYREQAKRGILTRPDAAQRVDRLSGTTDYSGFKRVDMVIEAVFEDLALKQKVVAEVEAATPDHCIFASNTSALPIGEIGAHARRPENLIGMHFFSPVPKMPLLEIIVTPKTSAQTTATCAEYGRKIGKTVIVVKDAPGFYTSRVLAAMFREVAYLLADGADAEVLDNAMLHWGFPVGPITLLDEVGIDVGVKVAKFLHSAFGERMNFPEGLVKVHDTGRLGRKNGKGFFVYKNGKKMKQIDLTVYDLLPHGRERVPFFETEVQDRLGLAFANEAALCLEEGVIATPRDGDLGAILGLGFPPFLGGPFRWLDALGAAKAVQQMEHLEKKFGVRYRAAKSLADMARDGKRFYSSRRAEGWGRGGGMVDNAIVSLSHCRIVSLDSCRGRRAPSRTPRSRLPGSVSRLAVGAAPGGRPGVACHGRTESAKQRMLPRR
ncbi:MAG: enoyl-CoA hydratase/isomerase family protein [Planctomycetes bacterium]|nr:enoyl-CoA hydratase/isomerase family protein [Planctomycetota bacterium]